MSSDEPRERFNRGLRYAANSTRPCGGTVTQVHFEVVGTIGVTLEVVPVRVAIAEQAVHNGTGHRTIRARTDTDEEIRLLGSRVAIGVDNHQLCVALAARGSSH